MAERYGGTGEMPKETKGNGEVGKPNEFSGCLIPLFRLRPLSYFFAISSNSRAVKLFVWMTRESSGGRGTFREKLVRGEKFYGFIDHTNFRLGPYCTEEF